MAAPSRAHGPTARWMQIALWTAGVVGEMGRAFAQAVLGPARRAVSDRTRRRLLNLGEAVRGNTKGAIAAVFGPPPTAQIPPASTPNSITLYHADIWYYPLDVRRQRAMVIQFQEGVARHVEFITTPRRPNLPAAPRRRR